MCNRSMNSASVSEIEKLVDNLFSQKWTCLHNVDVFKQDIMKNPGVYIIAFSDNDLHDKIININDIFYVGQSTSAGGVRQRLQQFKSGIEANNYHSGAMRIFTKYQNGKKYSDISEPKKKLFFAVQTINCESKKSLAAPMDFRSMGHVLCLENYIIARVLEQTGRTPELNKL